MKEIGEKLKAARESMGITIEEAAEDLKLRASQLEDIEYLEKVYGIKNIKKDKIRLVAEARLANNSASLQDIADSVSKKLGRKITKSNVAHIFRKIHELAKELGKWKK